MRVLVTNNLLPSPGRQLVSRLSSLALGPDHLVHGLA